MSRPDLISYIPGKIVVLLAPAEPNTGALLLLKDDTFCVVIDDLNQPTSMEFIGNKAYIVSLAGEVWVINNVSSPPYGH